MDSTDTTRAMAFSIRTLHGNGVNIHNTSELRMALLRYSQWSLAEIEAALPGARSIALHWIENERAARALEERRQTVWFVGSLLLVGAAWAAAFVWGNVNVGPF